MKKAILVTYIITLLFSCSYAQKIAAGLAEQKLLDVTYGSFASSKMDVFLPANRNEHTPFVIILHGGAWTLGHRDWGMRTQDSLAAHGIASANMDYRYADDSVTHYKDLLKDIDSVISYCVAHAGEWHTRTTNFIMNGESAGAHLALLYGYTTSNTISAIVAECAPTNVADTALLNYYSKDASTIRAICKMAGAKYIPSRPLDPAFTGASPVHQVKNIPTLFFHGTNDLMVPYSQALALESALKNKGFIYKFVSMPGAGHDVGFNTLEGRTKIYGEMVKWIEQYGRQ
jgi:acetyl esterase/lipase